MHYTQLGRISPHPPAPVNAPQTTAFLVKPLEQQTPMHYMTLRHLRQAHDNSVLDDFRYTPGLIRRVYFKEIQGTLERDCTQNMDKEVKLICEKLCALQYL